MLRASHTCSPRSRVRESGLALVIALIVLVAMTLAGIALVRSVDTGVLIAGNLAFRQGATVAGDTGVETARTWLMGNGSSLTADSPGNGYYSTSQQNLDLTGNSPDPSKTAFDWGSNAKCLAEDAAGNAVCYVIHRLCENSGPLDSSTCSTAQAVRGGSSLGSIRPMETFQERSWSMVATMGYYRVTVRIAGPRNNISYIQTFLVI